MNARIAAVLAVFAAMLCILPASAVLLEDSEASSSDVEWRDPPNADYVIEITQDLSFKSNDPEYVFRLVGVDQLASSSSKYPGLSEDSYSDMSQFVRSVRNIGIYSEVDDPTSDGWTDACVPSWIDAEIVKAGYGEYDDGVEITIRPALQAVSEDTHGEYWIYYSITQDLPGSSSTTTKTFLITFSVDVEWNGGVIVPDTYNRFYCYVDFGEGYIYNYTPEMTASDVTSASFGFPSDVPDREGLVLLGYSASPDGEIITDDSFVVSSSGSNVEISDDGSGGTIYSATFYAVWNQEKFTIPTFWDGLIELFSDPMVLLFMAVMFLAVCLFIRNRNGGRYRWSPSSPSSVPSYRS